MPTTPMPVSASLTSSSLNGLMTASIFFIAGPPEARGATPVPNATRPEASANRVLEVRLGPASHREDAYESGSRQPSCPRFGRVGSLSRPLRNIVRRAHPGRCGMPWVAPAAPRSEPDEARARSAPERTWLYVRTRDEGERSGTLIGVALSRALRNAVLPHLGVQRGTAEAEQRRRGLLVPARALERLQNRRALDLFQLARRHLG